MKKQLHLRIPEDLIEKIKLQANAESLSINEYVISVLSDIGNLDNQLPKIQSNGDSSDLHLLLSGNVAAILRNKATNNNMSARAYVRRLILFEKLDFSIFGYDKASELYDLFKLYKEEIELLAENLSRHLSSKNDDVQLGYYLKRIIYNQQVVAKAFDRYYHELFDYQVYIKRRLLKILRDNIYGN